MNQQPEPRLQLPDDLRPVWAEINLDHIAHNIREIRRKAPKDAKIMAIVKANGYGHGALQVGRTALANGAALLGVAIVEEAIHLRKGGITAPIHILGMPPAGQAELVVENDASCAISSWTVAEALSQAAQRLGKAARVHLKVDTGMGRLGLLPGDAPEFAEKLTHLPGLQVEGIFTHFATADEADKSFTRSQFQVFRKVQAALEARGIRIPLAHVANSAAILDLPEMCTGAVRPGIMTYGLYPSRDVSRSVELRPAMRLKARVVLARHLPAGAGISYGRTYVTKRPTTVALLPLGYADGFSRLLSNKAEVLIRGRRMPVVGRICMDQSMVAAPVGAEVAEGEEAVIFGTQGQEAIPVEEVADRLRTINYEVVCMVGARVPRVYIQDGRVSEIVDVNR
ncbi:MAG: alanine racemase [Firmicutes bacterium]|nr:alanine racemase [Bacillota bacterium]